MVTVRVTGVGLEQPANPVAQTSAAPINVAKRDVTSVICLTPARSRDAIDD
jgi:hypothetical protein